ncbi:MAG: glucose/sorbosone dehydrogenase [Alphaproteobacteria bacterium]|nr:glucose/sorbosone dehydrogenase [Alphaproteobacteria bacterium]
MTRFALIQAPALAGLLALAACGRDPAPPSTQYGANPTLPAPRQYVLPPTRIAPPVGWGATQVPEAAPELEVRVFATGFEHPRSVYTLPNGDVLVVETNGPPAPVNRPKDYLFAFFQNRAGSGAPGGNRITLLRDADGDGRPELRTIFLDHLNTPFGVALVGNQLYVADTDALLRFPYVPGETRIAAPAVKVTDLPAGSINHNWT